MLLLLLLASLSPLQAADNGLKKQVAALVADIRHGKPPVVDFDFDSAKLRLEYYDTLDAVAELLIENPNVKLMLIANTCTIGTPQYNYDLGKRRARAVREYLVQRGVPAPSIRYRSVGYDKPSADNSTEEGREQNRRVELRFTRRDWDSVF